MGKVNVSIDEKAAKLERERRKKEAEERRKEEKRIRDLEKKAKREAAKQKKKKKSKRRAKTKEEMRMNDKMTRNGLDSDEMFDIFKRRQSRLPTSNAMAWNEETKEEEQRQ